MYIYLKYKSLSFWIFHYCPPSVHETDFIISGDNFSTQFLELHYVQHREQDVVNAGTPALMEMTIEPMFKRMVVGFQIFENMVHYPSFVVAVRKKG